MLAPLPHSKKVLGLNPGPFCVESACSPHACMGFPRVLRFPSTTKDMDVRVNTSVSVPKQDTGKDLELVPVAPSVYSQG